MSKKLIIKTPITNESEDYLLNLPNKSGGEFTIATTSDVSTKADDNAVVHKGSSTSTYVDESIYGNKTFEKYTGITFASTEIPHAGVKINAGDNTGAAIKIASTGSGVPIVLQLGKGTNDGYGTIKLHNYPEISEAHPNRDRAVFEWSYGTGASAKQAYLLFPNAGTSQDPKTIAVDEDVVHRGSASDPVNNEDIYGQKTFKHFLIADNDVYVHNNKHIYFHGTDSLNSTWLSQDSSTGTLRFYLPQYSAETSNCEIHLPRKSGIIATTNDIKDSIVNNIAPEYSAAGFYVKGSKVIYGGQLYVCTAANGADHEA